MKQSNNTIENVLMEWGRRQQEKPSNNLAMKNLVLANFPDAPKTISGIKFRAPWLPLALTGLAVITLIYSSSNSGTKSQSTTSSLNSAFSCSNDSGLRCSESSVAPSLGRGIADFFEGNSSNEIYPAPPVDNAPLTDTREFLKTSYSAIIKSRHVAELAQTIQTTIRGFDGRVDSSSSSEETGYVNFVVPASKLDAFREEIKSIAGVKFYTESQSSQNLLPEKQSIEQQQTQTQSTLDELITNRELATHNHEQTLASLQPQLASAANQLRLLQTEAANNPVKTEETATRRQQLQAQIAVLNSRIANENSQFTNQLNSIDSQIQGTKAELTKLDGQNTQLLNNVATVNGYISLSHISLLGILNLYFGPYWLPALLILFAVVLYIVQKRQNRILIL